MSLPQHVPQEENTGTVAVRAADAPAVLGWPELASWVQRRRVLLAALVLIALQLVLKAVFLSHFFFWQDDFRYLDRGLDNGFNWKYLMWVDAGHLIPGPFAVSWLVARVSLYDWALATAVTLVLLAAACLALLRLLRNLFGDRPAILIPLALYLFSPLTFAALGWWSSAIEALPLHLAIFMALDAHVRYLRDGRYRHAVAAAAWMALGMLFFEKGMVIPPLVFAVTSAFFVGGHWAVAARQTVIKYWRAWLLYVAVLAGYGALFLTRLGQSSNTVGTSPYRHALAFMSGLVRETFVPGALGGPWHWTAPTGVIAYTAPPSGLAWLVWIVAVVVIVASIWNRRYAWRAWAILAGWLLLADMVPVVIGRASVYGGVLGFDTRYVADALAVLAVCAGLAFWPVVGQRDNRRAPTTPPMVREFGIRAMGALIGAFIFGSLWSMQAYLNVTSSTANRQFITNARQALALAPYGAVIVDGRVPPSLLLGTFERYSFASKVIGEMARGTHASKLRWTQSPAGTIDNLFAFGQDGRLRQAAVVGVVSRPLLPGVNCWPTADGMISVQFSAPSSVLTSTLRFAYVASASQTVTVQFGSDAAQVALQPGLHTAYVPVSGSSTGFTVSDLGSALLCVGTAVAGAVLPSNGGAAIPPVQATP